MGDPYYGKLNHHLFMVKLMVSSQELDLQLVGILNTKIGGDPY